MFPAILILVIVAFGLWLDIRNGTLSKVKIPANISIFMPWYDDAIRFTLDLIGFLKSRQIRDGSVFEIRLAGRRVIVTNNLDGILRIMRDSEKTLQLPNQQILESLGGVKGHIPTTLLDRLTTHVGRTFTNRGIPHFSHIFNRHIFRHFQSLGHVPPETRIPLRRFVERALYEAVSVAVFGPDFPLECHEESSLVNIKAARLFGPAIFVSGQVKKVRDSLKRKLGTYINGCWDDEIGVKGAPAGVTEIIRILRECTNTPAVSAEDAQGMLLVFLTHLHSNTHRIVEWLFLHILSDSRAFLRLRREVDHAIDAEFGNLETLLSAAPQRLGVSSFPLLESALMETMRMWHASIAVREALEDTKIPSDDPMNPSVARPGDLVMGNSYAFNMSDEVFEEAETFQVDRFVGCSAIKDEDKSRSVPLGSFGGGVRACKGRDFAMYEMKVFVILCLRLLDLKAEDARGQPCDSFTLKANPTLTVATFAMCPSQEVFLRIQRRA